MQTKFRDSYGINALTAPETHKTKANYPIMRRWAFG